MDRRPAFHSRRAWLPVLVTLTLLAGLCGWVGWHWQALEKRSASEDERRFVFAVNDIEHTLKERMRAYEMVLRGLSGFVAGSGEVTPEDWTRATDQLQLQDLYPGIQAVSLARYATPETLTQLVADIRRNGRPGFRMYPEGARDEYLVVDFIHPTDWRNRRVVGYDMLSEPGRREAIESAREKGVPVMTGPLRLKQETEQHVQVGVLLYLPVYRPNAPTTTRDERRAAFAGTLHGAFRLNDLLEGILGSRSSLFQLQLYDAAEPDAALLTERQPISETAQFKRTRNLYMYGRSWQLVVASTPEYETILRGNRQSFSLLGALTAALLFSLMVGSYLYLRERTLRESRALSLKLQERESRFRQLIEKLPVATLLCNDRGRIELANQSAASLLGTSIEGLLDERVSRYVPGVLIDESRAGPMAANQEEFQAQRDDGSLVPVAVSLTQLSREDGLHHVINLVDLQARKSAEERFRNVVEASPNALALVDEHGIITMVNRQTEAMFGYDRQQLLGQPVEMLLPEVLRETHRELLQGYMRNAEPRRMGSNRELFGRHADGRPLPLEVGLSPMRAGDKLMVQAVIIDISHRKAAERRLRDQADELALANRYKSEFLANMSHELRTPLNSILILSDQMRQNTAGNLTEKQVRHADIMHRAGNDLLQLINDVLDLAKIEAGRMQLDIEPLDLEDLLGEVEASLRPMAEQKGLALNVRIEPGVCTAIRSDRVRLEQILRNLLSNALKFTERGSVDIIVDRVVADEDEAPDSETLRIRVCDTGIGIPAEHHERIFQAFQQIDGSISRHYGGTGLGLAITRQLVEVLDGRVTLTSAPGEGSCFAVQIPVTLARPAEPRGEPRGESRPVTRMSQRPWVLIVDSDVEFAAQVAEAAGNHGFDSLVCHSAEEAQQALKNDRFAAVVLDVLLPDHSGWQVLASTRGEERHHDVSVIVISSVPQPHDWHDDDSRYLVKPVPRAELERLFIELARQKHNPLRLLLLETDRSLRQPLRDHLERLGYSVTVARNSDEARLAYAEQSYSAMIIDHAFNGESGLDLLAALDRLRPLGGARVVLGVDHPLDGEELRRLERYAGVTLSKERAVEQIGPLLRPQEYSNPVSRGAVEQPLLGQRVLLVDDDVRTIYTLTAQLDELGLQVVPATDAEEALDYFDEEPIDLVLLDMSAAKLDGRTLIHRLRNEHGCQVPIIALTARAMKEDKERCVEAGADDHLPKPVAQSELAERLEHWLGVAMKRSAD